MDFIDVGKRILGYLYNGKMSMKIVQDREKLSRSCKSVHLKEGLEIGERLLGYLEEHDGGIGLAANQVGIDARVCVVNVGRPLIFVNPKVVGKFGAIRFKEGCLSFPDEEVLTKRYKNIVVRDEAGGERIFDAKNLLETVCVQHEIDHLNGLTLYDRRLNPLEAVPTIQMPLR